MRWLFLFVLVLNFAYVAWEWSQPEDVLTVQIANRDAQRIVLLSEIGQDSVAVSVDSGNAAATPGGNEDVVIKGGCFTLGPFKDLEKLRAVTRGIKKYVVDASYRSHDEQEQEMFWVYLSPAKDFNAARVLADRLKEKKVKDYFIVKSGPKVNGVSLGHFREKNRAYTHAENIKNLGFEPEVEAIFKTYTIYWLDYDVISGESVPENVLDKHLTGKINHLVRDCA